MRIYMLGAKGFPAHLVRGGGGVERHVEEVATRLAARGHQVYVYARTHSSDPRLKRWKGVNIIRLPSIRTKNLDTITHVFLATLHVLKQKADIVHYHGIGPSTLAWIPRLFMRRSRVVATFHSRDRFDPKWSWFARLYLRYGEWACTHYPHATVAVSHILQLFCRRLYGRETVYVPNGAQMPAQAGTDELAAWGLKPNGYFLGIGRLVPNKAFDMAMEAYAKVETSMPFVIAGDAEYADEYIEKLERLAARDGRIRLIGFQTGAALKQLLAHCYAVINPSRSEGLSAAVLEAMANAKTVILSDIKENLELIDHSGIAFRVDSRRALKEAIEWALEDPSMVRERGLRATDVIRKRYTWDRVVDRLENLYEELRRGA